MLRVGTLLLCLGSVFAALECDICKDIFNSVDGDVIDLNATSIIDKACDGVPDILDARKACVKAVTAIAEKTLNDTVETALSPAMACGCLGYCDAEAPETVALDLRLDLHCDACELTVKAFDAALTSSGTKAKLEAQIAAACGKLPLGSARCAALFDGKIDGMLSCEAAGALAPATFCAATGRCAPGK